MFVKLRSHSGHLGGTLALKARPQLGQEVSLGMSSLLFFAGCSCRL